MTQRTRPHTRITVAGLAVIPLLALSLAACQSQQRSQRSSTSAPLASDRPIVLDGDTAEWPSRSAIVADADSIFFRITLEGQQHPLQAAPETLALWIDLDDDASTGDRMSSPQPASALGVDAIVEFSPRDPGGTIRPGITVYSTDGSGARLPIPQDALEVIAAPTFGAPTFEVRLSRHADPAATPALAQALRARGRGQAMYILSDAAGRPVGWSDPERFSKPAASEAPATSDAIVPPKQPGTVRILSYNVFRAQLMKNPSTFARIFQVAQPDIILLQEWETDTPTVKAWFNAVVTGEHAWHAVTGEDVAIVSPHPLQRLGPESITTDGSMDGQPRTVRAIGAIIHTPAGDVAAASAHLKCCGTTGTSEDSKRMAEARAINEAIASAFATSGAAAAIIGGDMNLVGSRIPLDMLRVGADLDGSELAVADPMVIGDAALYTWRDAGTPFPPGRLDYILYTDSSAALVNAFVLDTSRLSQRSLARMGLDRGDTAASDHLPVIIDLKPR